ncbi:MAG: hypothetical protein VX563_04615, partial [Planctomycetota bacterium]|nr:hypothetical protein [Planctomycetota bacterium]
MLERVRELACENAAERQQTKELERQLARALAELADERLAREEADAKVRNMRDFIDKVRESVRYLIAQHEEALERKDELIAEQAGTIAETDKKALECDQELGNLEGAVVDRIAALEAKNAALQAENASLKEQMREAEAGKASLVQENGELTARAAALAEMNAELQQENATHKEAVVEFFEAAGIIESLHNTQHLERQVEIADFRYQLNQKDKAIVGMRAAIAWLLQNLIKLKRAAALPPGGPDGMGVVVQQAAGSPATAIVTPEPTPVRIGGGAMTETLSTSGSPPRFSLESYRGRATLGVFVPSDSREKQCAHLRAFGLRMQRARLNSPPAAAPPAATLRGATWPPARARK